MAMACGGKAFHDLRDDRYSKRPQDTRA